MSKSFVFIAAPASGHVNPTLPVVAELTRRGHAVTFVTGPAHLAAVAAAGARAVEIPWLLDPTSLSRERFSTTTLLELLNGLLDAVTPLMDQLVDEARGADCVCFDATVAPVAAALAERLGVPAVSLIPSMAVNEHLPLAELLPPDFRPDNEALVRYGTRLHEFGTSQGLSAPLLPLVVPEVPLTLVFVPPAFQIAADTFDASYRFVGPTVPTPGEDWPAPEGRKLLLVSLGTAFTDRPDVFRTCAAAFADTDWHVVMSTGRTARQELGTLPVNVEAAASVPQTAILRQATAFISHAGMNSIMESLACAVPLVTLPQVPEQALNARRVVDLGLGASLESQDLTPDLVRETVLAVAADERVRDRLKWMSGEIEAADGASTAAYAILGLLE